MLTAMSANPGQLIVHDVRRRFDRAARHFDGADFVHRHTFDGLTQRLSPVVIKPSRILDLGCATGTGSHQLARQYRRARVISFDASGGMLEIARKNRSRFSKRTELQGDACCIPLQDGCVDLVFSNLLLPWVGDLPSCFAEVRRVLRKDGVFAFATLGPESLDEIRAAWLPLDQDWHANAYPDMHDIGDALVRAGLRDPVLDVDYLQVTYRDTDSLYQDLTKSGARNSLQNRRKTLTGKRRFRKMEENLVSRVENGTLSFNLELIYGHAWGNGPQLPAGEFRLDPTTISRRRD
jgi:malonyl-CoA O-methyltransferase